MKVYHGLLFTFTILISFVFGDEHNHIVNIYKKRE
jgi:hypothetical protein